MIRYALAALFLAACAQTPSRSEGIGGPTEPRAWIGDAKLSVGGLGPLRMGGPIADAQAALGYRLEQGEHNPVNPSCGEWSIHTAPNAGVYLLTNDGFVERISLFGDSGLRTAEGIAIGDTAAQVRAAYPNAARENAEYTPAPGHELFVWTDPENYIGLRFEIGEDGTVTDIHAGAQLRNIEGCAGL